MDEILIFGAFGALQVAFHHLHKKAHHRGTLTHKLKHSHYLVWLAHPAVSHAVQDYAIHFVIYSGKIITHH